jgi:hypothetical protein
VANSILITFLILLPASLTLLPIISQRPSDHDLEPLQINIQEIGTMHVVYILDVATEIVLLVLEYLLERLRMKCILLALIFCD